MKIISKQQRYKAICGIGFAALIAAGCVSIPAPTEQITIAKVAVTNATSAGGNEYASEDMRAAQDKLNRAIQAMTTEDYKNARVLAEQAQADAQLAESKARAAKASKAALSVQEGNHVLRKEIDRNSQ